MSETLIIENDHLRVGISTLGAELQFITGKQNGIEYLWNGGAPWPKKSPVLFPIVGGLKNNNYSYNDKQFELGRHGFAREMEFTVKKRSDHSAVLCLATSRDSLRHYPFRFLFTIIYTLRDSNLEVRYEVRNRSKGDLWFSVGGHPAFAVPLKEGLAFDDYLLKFELMEDAGIWPLSKDGLLLSAPVPFLKSTNTIHLRKDLFYKDALVFKDLLSHTLSLGTGKDEHGLTVNFADFRYLGIWSARDAGFVCIEPWDGIADSVNSSGDLKQKEGIRHLGPLGIYSKSWNVDFY